MQSLKTTSITFDLRSVAQAVPNCPNPPSKNVFFIIWNDITRRGDGQGCFHCVNMILAERQLTQQFSYL